MNKASLSGVMGGRLTVATAVIVAVALVGASYVMLHGYRPSGSNDVVCVWSYTEGYTIVGGYVVTQSATSYSSGNFFPITTVYVTSTATINTTAAAGYVTTMTNPNQVCSYVPP